MELEKLLKQREVYASKIVSLAIKIAGIFLIPVLIIAGVSYLFQIPFMYLFPIAFVGSWVGVIILYKIKSREVRELDAQIKNLREKEKELTNNAPDALQE